jgi:hypothetical protein
VELDTDQFLYKLRKQLEEETGKPH